MTVTETDLTLLAQNGKELFVGFLLPLLVMWLTKLNWRTEYKFFAAAAASLVAGALVALSDGKLTSASLVENLIVILTTSQFVYFTFFKALGLEKWIYPQAAVVDQAQQVVKNELSDLTREEANKVLDPAIPATVDVVVDKKV